MHRGASGKSAPTETRPAGEDVLAACVPQDIGAGTAALPMDPEESGKQDPEQTIPSHHRLAVVFAQPRPKTEQLEENTNPDECERRARAIDPEAFEVEIVQHSRSVKRKVHTSEGISEAPEVDMDHWPLVMYSTAALVVAILTLCQPYYLKECNIYEKDVSCTRLHSTALHFHSDESFSISWLSELDLCNLMAAASLAGAIVCGCTSLLTTRTHSELSEQSLNHFHDRFTATLHKTLVVFFPSIIAMHQVWNLVNHHMIKFTMGDMWLTCHCCVSLLCYAYGTSKRCLVVHRFILFFVQPLRLFLGELGLLAISWEKLGFMVAISPPFAALLQRSRSGFLTEMLFTNALVTFCVPLGIAHAIFMVTTTVGSILLERKLQWLAVQHKEGSHRTTDADLNVSTCNLNLKYLDNRIILLLISSAVLLVSVGSIKVMGLDSSPIIIST